jgi:H+/gluconate symporter-like permease
MEQIALIVAYLIIAILIFVIAHFQRKARKQHNEISSAIVSITKNWVEHESYLKKSNKGFRKMTITRLIKLLIMMIVTVIWIALFIPAIPAYLMGKLFDFLSRKWIL